MLYAADFRAHARASLAEKWGLAVLAGLIAALLGAGSLEGLKLNLEFSNLGTVVSFELFGHTIFSTLESHPDTLLNWLLSHAALISIAAILMAIVFGIIGSTVSVGYAKFNLRLVDGFEADLQHMVAYFPWWTNNFCAHFLMSLYTLLWSLLFLIPGIVAGLSYSMTDYILAENPELTASQAIQLSKGLMYGNRWRLFCLQLSFIGWAILCSFTMGIGHLWLTPYRQAAYASFYRSLR